MFQLKGVFSNSPVALIAFICVLFLSGCGTVQHDAVFVSGYAPSPKATVVLGEVTDAAPVIKRGNDHKDFDIAKAMREQLEAKLRESGLLTASGRTEGSLVLSVKIVDYEPGDAFKRWLMPGYGSTVLSVECTLHDGDKKVATVTARRTVDAGGGYTIGAWQTIFGKVAEDIVSDLKKKLRQPV